MRGGRWKRTLHIVATRRAVPSQRETARMRNARTAHRLCTMAPRLPRARMTRPLAGDANSPGTRTPRAVHDRIEASPAARPAPWSTCEAMPRTGSEHCADPGPATAHAHTRTHPPPPHPHPRMHAHMGAWMHGGAHACLHTRTPTTRERDRERERAEAPRMFAQISRLAHGSIDRKEFICKRSQVNHANTTRPSTKTALHGSAATAHAWHPCIKSALPPCRHCQQAQVTNEWGEVNTSSEDIKEQRVEK